MTRDAGLTVTTHDKRWSSASKRTAARREEARRDIGKLCAASGKQKRKYRDQVDALLANAGKPTIARAYRCSACGFWHLTRRPAA